MLRQKNFLLLAVTFIYSVSAYAGQEEETPRILLFFGRFHPLVLHLPIGALLLTLFLEIIVRTRKIDFKILIRNALAFSAFFTVLTAILGYLLSLEGGYGNDVIEIHMYAGFTMAFLTCLLFFANKTKISAFRKMYIPLFVITLLLTTFTGHYGSILTHGDTFLTDYSPLNFGEEQEIIIDTDSLYYYKNVINPILEDKCIQCHNSNKMKGELNMSTIEHIKKGGENGEIIIGGNVEESPMYTSLLLPFEEDNHMPPSGKPQLTRNEIWLIKHWIASGADFNKQTVNYAKNDTLSNMLIDYLILPKKKVNEANLKDINKLINHGFVIRKLVFGKPYLSATYSNKDQKISKKAMKSLVSISDQLIELNLQESKLTDDLANSIKKLKSLRILRLDQTMITDKSLDYLKEQKDLQTLNLFNTSITNEGLSELLNYIEPKKIYFGNERKQRSEFVMNDETGFQTKISQGLLEGFIEKTQLEKPVVLGDKTIFENEIKIEVKGSLKNEKIYYTLNGQDPDSTSLVYTEPFLLKESSQFKTRSYKKDWYSSDIVEKNYSKIKFKIKEVSVKYEPEKSYPGIEKLINLEKGSTNFKDGKWNGYHEDLVATLDMGKIIDFEGISVSCLEGISNYIFYPLYMEVYAGDELGSMKQIGNLNIPPTDRNRDTKIKDFTIDFEKVKARYIKIKMKNMKIVPKWHEGAGAKSWIFIDEIMIL